MLGKIVQVLGVPLKDEFKVVYGADFTIERDMMLNFGIISITNAPPGKEKHYTYIGGVGIDKEFNDGYKNITVWRVPEEEIKETDIEEFLFVIIPNSLKIETTAEKIAGRYPYEAILKMYKGDILTISKGSKSKLQTYMAVQAGNELFLIKKNR